MALIGRARKPLLTSNGHACMYTYSLLLHTSKSQRESEAIPDVLHHTLLIHTTRDYTDETRVLSGDKSTAVVCNNSACNSTRCKLPQHKETSVESGLLNNKKQRHNTIRTSRHKSTWESKQIQFKCIGFGLLLITPSFPTIISGLPKCRLT